MVDEFPRHAFAPGRVNLIGEHTDYTGGYVLPIAIDLGTTVVIEEPGEDLELQSETEPEIALVSLPVDDPHTHPLEWARHIAAIAEQLQLRTGGKGTVSTTLPVGAGLSSSSALGVATALAFGFRGEPLELAQLSQTAEQRATRVPCGIMDQLASAAGVPDHCLLIDCRNLRVEPVPFPEELDVWVVHSGQSRTVATSEYSARTEQCAAAEREIGPLRDAKADDVRRIIDPVIRSRARHVVGENQRVLQFVAALQSGDTSELGELLYGSHQSLRDDFEVPTARLDEVVDLLRKTPGVIGARLTGAGFGGCLVALVEPGSRPPSGLRTWEVRPSRGAYVAGR